MKMISKIACAGLGLMFAGSSVFAQSLADAKKAIDAEQYQKAKSMLKNLTVTQADKDENYFYLGWVYLKQDYADSAKASRLSQAALRSVLMIVSSSKFVSPSVNERLKARTRDVPREA